MAIKIVRFKDGLDVICDCKYTKNDMVEITDPMLFEIRSVNLILQCWLPMAVIKDNKVEIEPENILCTMEPTDDFQEYYSSTIIKLKEASKKEKEEEIRDEILSAFEEKGSLKGSLIH